MQFIATADGAFRCELRGDGPSTLVLVHELGGSIESWDGLLPHLPAGLRIVRYDLRGAGLSEKTRGTLDLNRLSRDLAQMLDALGITGRVMLAGCAAGAAVALAFASQNPQRASAVVAMAPATGGATGDALARGLARADQVEQEGMRFAVESTMNAVYPEALRTDPARFAWFRTKWLGNDPGGYAATLRMLVTMDITPFLPAIACPVLILAGALDPTRTPDQIREKFGVLRKVRIEVLNSGHFMAIPTPELVAGAMRSFLIEQGGAA